MKIEKGKPLPEHTKIDYYECCAKLILLEIFPNDYSFLEIKDKPDLHGENVGIEVTIANNQKHQEALNNWIKANYCDDGEKKQRYIERMKQLGVTYTEGFQVWPGTVPSLQYIKQAVDIKVNKLQSGSYKVFPRYELFIFTDTWLHEQLVKEACDYFSKNNIYEFYQRVYVLEEGSTLHVFEDGRYRELVIDSVEQTDRNIRARELVEQEEKK